MNNRLFRESEARKVVGDAEWLITFLKVGAPDALQHDASIRFERVRLTMRRLEQVRTEPVSG